MSRCCCCYCSCCRWCCCCCCHRYIPTLTNWSRRIKWGVWGGRPDFLLVCWGCAGCNDGMSTITTAGDSCISKQLERAMLPRESDALTTWAARQLKHQKSIIGRCSGDALQAQYWELAMKSEEDGGNIGKGSFDTKD